MLFSLCNTVVDFFLGIVGASVITDRNVYSPFVFTMVYKLNTFIHMKTLLIAIWTLQEFLQIDRFLSS